MIRHTLILQLVFFSLLSSPSPAAENDLGKIFDTYQKSYQTNDFVSAKNTIEEALQSHTHNSYLIYNLGLTEYKLGRVGAAIGLWRRALSVNPQLKQASEAIDYAISQMQTKPLSQNTDSTWAWLQSIVVKALSFNYLFPLFLLLATLSGMGFIKYFAQKKTAFENDETTPQVSNRVWTLFSLMVIVGLLSAILFADHASTKATAILQPTSVKTGPDPEFGTLFEIPEGTEVMIRDKQEGWYKIEDPTGRLGWVSAEGILITTM